MVKVKVSKDKERDKAKERDRERERDSHKDKEHKDKEHKDKEHKDKSIGKPAIGKPANGKPAIGKPANGKPANGKPANGKPAIGKLANGKPAKELFKSPFSSDDLAKWRQLLLSRRAEISNDIDGLVKDAMEAEDGHTTPNHIAERGSDADLQDMSLGVAGEEKEVLWQIDRALRKILLSHPLPYGLCEYTKSAIPRTRLQLIPWTPLSIEGATHMEQNNLTIEDVLHDE
jgi:RNA polymerase-binding transcription factor DksA